MEEIGDRHSDSGPFGPLQALAIPFRRLRRWRRSVALSRRFRPPMVKMRKFYAQFIQPGDLAFDVGANVGSRTRVFLQLGAEVVAVEPEKKCARVLFASFYHDPHFHLVNKALGATDGQREMMVSTPHLSGGTLSQSLIDALVRSEQIWREDLWQETRRVSVTTLDSLIAKYGVPSFVKIDVEGFEHEVIRGLSRPIAALSFEFLPAHLEPALQTINNLQRFGPIRLNYAIEERFEWMLDRWVTPEEMIPILTRYHPKTDFLNGDVYVRFGV